MTIYTNRPNACEGTEQGIYLSGLQTLAEQSDSTAKNPVGVVTRYQGKLYRYVYLYSGTTVAGAPAYWVTTADPTLGLYSVTATKPATNDFAGVFLASSLTTSTYIWIQVAGLNESLVTTGSGAVVGDRLIASNTGQFDLLVSGVSGTNLGVIAVTVAEATTTTGGLILGPFGW